MHFHSLKGNENRGSAPSSRRRQRSSALRLIFRIRPQRQKSEDQKVFGFLWWGRTDSNHRSDTQQIYSLSPLATRELPHMNLRLGGAGRRTRTPDLLITNQLLYQLSYTGERTERNYYSMRFPKVKIYFGFL